MARNTKRRFVKDGRTGRITILPKEGASSRKGDLPDDKELLDALVEVEAMLSPVFPRDGVSPADSVPLLADAMYIRLTGEIETPPGDLRILLCEYILTVWSQGLFTPSAAFPYALEEVVSSAQASLQEQESQIGDEEVCAALSAALESPRPIEDGQLSPYERLKYDMRDIDQARDELIERGIRALEQKRYRLAEHYFRQAGKTDMLDESEAFYYLAMTDLWLLDFDEAAYLFEVDSQDREGEAPVSWLLAEWCAISAASSRAQYLAAIRDDMDERGDSITYKQELFDFDYQDYEDSGLQAFAAAFFAYLRGEYERCLDQLDECFPDFLELPDWFVSFWSAMAQASMGAYEEARDLLREALGCDIPPLLLLPLRWFERSHPEFYARFVSPLFTEYDLWKQVEARRTREQIVRDERRKQAQWVINRLEQKHSGFVEVRRELDAMRERRRLLQEGGFECRYLPTPLGEEFSQAYAGLLQEQGTGDDACQPVFVAEIPPPCSPRSSTYLVTALLAQLDDPLVHRRAGEARKRRRLIEVLHERKVELVILTCVEHLTTPAGRKLLRNEIEWLRHLFVNEIGTVPLLLVGEDFMIEEIRRSNPDFGHLLFELAAV